MKVSFDPSIKTALVVKMLVYGPAGARPLELLAAVDTGASTTMIPTAAARLLGYPLDSVQAQRIVMGGVFSAPRIALDRVDMGPASAHGVEAICHDLPKESMLDALVAGRVGAPDSTSGALMRRGLSFLTRFDVHFDFEVWEMELEPRTG